MKAVLAAAIAQQQQQHRTPKKPTENKNKMLKSQIIPHWFIQF